ncbi:hypothetical protein [Clostridium sp. M14]|nr:hypothetical protein [Clostridium sp. M14]
MIVFLDINGVELVYSDEDIIDLGLGVASGKYDAENVKEWIITFSNR